MPKGRHRKFDTAHLVEGNDSNSRRGQNAFQTRGTSLLTTGAVRAPCGDSSLELFPKSSFEKLLGEALSRSSFEKLLREAPSRSSFEKLLREALSRSSFEKLFREAPSRSSFEKLLREAPWNQAFRCAFQRVRWQISYQFPEKPKYVACFLAASQIWGFPVPPPRLETSTKGYY